MTSLEEKVNQVLANPQLMQQIMSLAQSMGTSQPEPVPDPPKESPLPLDPGILQKAAAMASRTGVDADQKALLRALRPYVSRDRVNKLEKAMQAAKIAVFASSMLRSQNRR